MMTASMLRRRTKTRIETLATNFSYQLYFIETCICQLNGMYLPNSERNVFAKLPF